MVALLALLLGAAHPPAASVAAGANRVPLAVSSWCWAGHCGAPISASTRIATVSRGGTIHVDLQFTPSRVRVEVAGVRTRTTSTGREITWRATRGGGMTINVTGPRGWVIYVGRLRIK